MAVNETNVLIIVNNWGIEETELTRPLRDLPPAARSQEGRRARHRRGDHARPVRNRAARPL